MSLRALAQCLIESEPGRLEIIARRWGVDLPERRRDAASVLAESMLAPGEVERQWAALPPDQQEALMALHAAGGSVPWATFTRRWGEVRTMGPGRMARERPWEMPVSPVEGLWYRGLLFRAFVEGPTGLYEVAFIPEEVQARLPIFPPPSTLSLSPMDKPAIVLPASEDLLDDGCTLLAYLQNDRVRPGPGGEWPPRDESRLTRRLRDPALHRLALLRHLAERLGWLRTDSAGNLRPSPGPATAWLQAPAQEQRAALARAWRDAPTWNDLWYVPTLRPENTGSWHNDPLVARQAILRHLSACRPGEWYSLSAFIAAVKESDPDFQRPDGDYSTWYIRDATTHAYLNGFESWDAVEGALIRFLITGPLAWMGLIALGLERTPGSLRQPERWDACAFSISPAGAAFLGLAAEEPVRDEEPPPLTVRVDGTVMVPAARRYERFQLSRVADWMRTGDPYVYRLTPASLERARAQNIPPEKVLAFLQDTAKTEVPRTLEEALIRWAQRGPQVRLEPGMLLRVQDEGLMREIVAAPAVRRFIREMISPTTALVTPGAWPRLVQALVERGLLPDVEEDV